MQHILQYRWVATGDWHLKGEQFVWLTSGGLIGARPARREARGALVGMAAADDHMQLFGDAVRPLEGLSDAGPLGGNHPIQLPVHCEQAAVQCRLRHQLRHLQVIIPMSESMPFLLDTI